MVLTHHTLQGLPGIGLAGISREAELCARAFDQVPNTAAAHTLSMLPESVTVAVTPGDNMSHQPPQLEWVPDQVKPRALFIV